MWLSHIQVVIVVQPLSHVDSLLPPWIVACQASLSFTIQVGSPTSSQILLSLLPSAGLLQEAFQAALDPGAPST